MSWDRQVLVCIVGCSVAVLSPERDAITHRRSGASQISAQRNINTLQNQYETRDQSRIAPTALLTLLLSSCSDFFLNTPSLIWPSPPLEPPDYRLSLDPNPCIVTRVGALHKILRKVNICLVLNRLCLSPLQRDWQGLCFLFSQVVKGGTFSPFRRSGPAAPLQSACASHSSDTNLVFWHFQKIKHS